MQEVRGDDSIRCCQRRRRSSGADDDLGLGAWVIYVEVGGG